LGARAKKGQIPTQKGGRDLPNGPKGSLNPERAPLGVRGPSPRGKMGQEWPNLKRAPKLRRKTQFKPERAKYPCGGNAQHPRRKGKKGFFPKRPKFPPH